jgi:hypothetical protein
VLAGKRDAAIGTIGVSVFAAHLVLAVVGAVGLTEWVSGLVAGLFLIGFVTLHPIIGSRIGPRPRRQRRDHHCAALSPAPANRFAHTPMREKYWGTWASRPERGARRAYRRQRPP